jgi:hypothetical protein
MPKIAPIDATLGAVATLALARGLFLAYQCEPDGGAEEAGARVGHCASLASATGWRYSTAMVGQRGPQRSAPDKEDRP